MNRCTVVQVEGDETDFKIDIDISIEVVVQTSTYDCADFPQGGLALLLTFLTRKVIILLPTQNMSILTFLTSLGSDLFCYELRIIKCNW